MVFSYECFKISVDIITELQYYYIIPVFFFFLIISSYCCLFIYVRRKMSIVPLVFRDWWEDMERPVSRIWDQYFGRGLHRNDLVTDFSDLGINRPFLHHPTPFRSLLGNNSTYYRPWRTVTRQNSGGSSTIKMEKDNFQVILDVQQFSPDEITVKTVDKNVVVEAKHEERQDEHGFISRQFVRRYILPIDYDAINVTSTLSSDGVLTVTAPRKVKKPIQHTFFLILFFLSFFIPLFYFVSFPLP